MQKSFIAIALALTLACAFAGYTPIAGGYSKVPQSVAADNESNYTNSSYLVLGSVTSGELDLVGANTTANFTNSGTWSAALRKLDGKTLAAGTNYSTISFAGGLQNVFYVNNIAISLVIENDGAGVKQISVYQSPISGGAALAKIVVSSNTNVNNTPSILGLGVIAKTVYVFYNASATANGTLTQVNVTNFAAGGAKGTLEFNLTLGYTGGLNVVWGEALGSNQLFANWLEGAALKDATIDVSKGTYTVNTVAGAWNSSLSCRAFATDKKWFGDLCWYTNSDINVLTTTYYVRSNTTNLVQLVANATNTTTFQGVYPYGPYIAITYTDSASTSGRTTLSYDIWNLDTGVAYRNKTAFVTYDSSNSSATVFRVTSGGLFTLLDNFQTNTTTGATVNRTAIQVGLVLGSSALTTVLGFLTIVAGLLLF